MVSKTVHTNKVGVAGTAYLYDDVIRTFDGEIYGFAPPPCKYVFAHDFDDFNFTVLLEYAHTSDRARLSDITVFGQEDAISINIFSPEKMWRLDGMTFTDYSVSFNKELRRVTVTGKTGWELMYDFERGLLALQISRFYFGKTAGKLTNTAKT